MPNFEFISDIPACMATLAMREFLDVHDPKRLAERLVRRMASKASR